MSVREVPASVGQRLLWIMQHYRGDDGALNCPILCRLRGPLDVARLRAALLQLARRHETLHTTFAGRGPALRQVIHDPPDQIELSLVDLSGRPDVRVALDEEVATELRRPIDPTVQPVRVTLWRLAPDRHVLCLNLHHLVTDAWSNSVLFADLMVLLDRAAGGRTELADPGWPYARFSQWQHEQLAGAEMAGHGEHWRERLRGASPPALPLLPDTGPGAARRTASIALDLDPSSVDRLRAMVRQQRATVFGGLLAAYYALLARLTGQDDLTIGSLFANRRRAEVQRTVGFLANLVMLRTRVPPQASFVDLLRHAQRTAADAFVHQAMPFHMLPTDTMIYPPPSPSGPPPLARAPTRPDDVMFQAMADPIYTTRVAGLDVEVLVPDGVGSRFALELALVAHDGTYRAVLFHDTARVPAAYAEEILGGYARIVREVAARPATPLVRLAHQAARSEEVVAR